MQMDILVNTMLSLYDHQTAEDYVFNTMKSLYGQQTAEDYMTQIAHSPSATPCKVKPTDTRPQALQVKGYVHKALGTANHLPKGNDYEPGMNAQMNILQPVMEGDTVAEDDLSQPAVRAMAKNTLQAACEAAVTTRQQAKSTWEEDHNQHTAEAVTKDTLQVMDEKHQLLDTSFYSLLGQMATGDHPAQATADTKLHADVLDALFNTAVALFDQQTTDDNMEKAIQAMAIQSPPAAGATASGKATDNNRPPKALQVKVEDHKTFDTAVTPPLDKTGHPA